MKWLKKIAKEQTHRQWSIQQYLRYKDYEIRKKEIHRMVSHIPLDELETENFITQAENYWIDSIKIRMNRTNDEFTHELMKNEILNVLGRARNRHYLYLQEQKQKEQEQQGGDQIDQMAIDRKNNVCDIPLDQVPEELQAKEQDQETNREPVELHHSTLSTKGECVGIEKPKRIVRHADFLNTKETELIKELERRMKATDDKIDFELYYEVIEALYNVAKQRCLTSIQERH